ncbi:serine hydrolase domain-containing protein [Dermacoccus abyssi]
MSLIVRHKSEAYRLRNAGRIAMERVGPLHEEAPMLEWGSVTKTVTAHVAEQLHRDGAIDLSAPVSEYLPETRLPKEVDVRSLAEHTSGLSAQPKGMITSMAEARDPYARYTTERFDAELLPRLSHLRHGPLGSFEYSNLGYAVLTRVLEVATGDPWWTLAQQRVFIPLGVTGVSTCPDPETVPVIRTWTGRVCKQWTFAGPFVGVGGLHGTFDALEHYATRRAQQTPGEKPFGWMDDGDQYWHNGGTLDHGAFVGVSHDGSRVMTVHTLGYNAGRVDKIVARLERQSRLESELLSSSPTGSEG